MSAPSADEVLRSAQFGRRSDGGELPQAQSAQDLLRLTDASKLHPLAGVGGQGELDYLFLDDGKLNEIEGSRSVLPSRGWGDELCYGTGTTYLSGLAAGGAWGIYEGIRRPLTRAAPSTAFTLAALNAPHRRAAAAAMGATGAAAGGPAAAAAASMAPGGAAAAPIGANAPPPPLSQATGTSSATAPPGASSAGPNAGASSASAAPRASPTFKLRLNTVLNQVTSRGTFVGNNAGVLALIYNAINCTIDKNRGKHDIYGSMVSGGLTGLIWKSTAGPKVALIYSGLLTVGAAAWTEFKHTVL